VLWLHHEALNITAPKWKRFASACWTRPWPGSVAISGLLRTAGEERPEFVSQHADEFDGR
jgi:hypothetical protein